MAAVRLGSCAVARFAQVPYVVMVHYGYLCQEKGGSVSHLPKQSFRRGSMSGALRCVAQDGLRPYY